MLDALEEKDSLFRLRGVHDLIGLHIFADYFNY